MNTATLVEWQRYSPTNGMVQCWWTHPILDLIEKWDWKDKTMLEFGCGRGTAWLRERTKWVDSVDADLEWAEQARKDCKGYNLDNLDAVLNGEIDELIDALQFAENTEKLSQQN